MSPPKIWPVSVRVTSALPTTHRIFWCACNAQPNWNCSIIFNFVCFYKPFLLNLLEHCDSSLFIWSNNICAFLFSVCIEPMTVLTSASPSSASARHRTPSVASVPLLQPTLGGSVSAAGSLANHDHDGGQQEQYSEHGWKVSWTWTAFIKHRSSTLIDCHGQLCHQLSI